MNINMHSIEEYPFQRENDEQRKRERVISQIGSLRTIPAAMSNVYKNPPFWPNITGFVIGLLASERRKLVMALLLFAILVSGVKSWTGEIHGRVVCDVCGDSSIGPEDHVLEGAEVAVLCITKSGEVLNYQAFTNAKGAYTVAETMPESDRWDACLARPISSFHEHCTHLGNGSAGVKFNYNHPSGYSHTVRPFVYRPINAPTYCM